MDESDLFRRGEFENEVSLANSTAWASRIAPKFKGRRTYGRRGSDVVSHIKSAKNVPLLKSKQRNQNKNKHEDYRVDAQGEDNAQYAFMRSPYNSPLDEHLGVPSPPPRLIKKWKTISGESPVVSKPNKPPKLMRSQSVSALMSRPISNSSSRSTSVASSFASFAVKEGGSDLENFNPNYVTTSNNIHGRLILDENTSPKRSAVADASKKDRKKCKPTKYSFLNKNDFGTLNTPDKNDKNLRLSEDSRSKIKTVALGSFSDLARTYGEVDHAWNTSTTSSCPINWNESKEDAHGRSSSTDLFSPASYSFNDETMDGAESVLSTTMSMTSSTRKRGVCKSQFLIDESPVVRSRFRILSPLPVRTTDPFSLTKSIDSKHNTTSRLMNISFCSARSEKRVVRTELDVTMSDEDVDSDISVDSEDITAASFHAFHRTKLPSLITNANAFEPENATVDDVKKLMTSYEDIAFLSRSLKQNVEGQRGCLSWNVAPPVAWTAKRRDVFFQATRKLGFTFRAGGGNVAYIQISKTRGSRLLSLLKSTLETFDEGADRQRLLDTKANNTADKFCFSLTRKKVQPVKAIRSTPKELLSCSCLSSSADRATEELSQILSKLDMNPGPYDQTETENKNCIFSAEDCFESSDNHRYAISTKPRDSSEYHSSSKDLNTGLYGTTCTPLRLQRRPSRLSLNNMSSKTRLDSHSPLFTDSDLPNPTHMRTHTNCSMNSNEFLLTPLVGRQNDAWGSRPFNNHDWGNSASCEANITLKLFQRFCQVRKRAGFNECPDEILPNDLGSSYPGLDFEPVSHYYEEFESSSTPSFFVDTNIRLSVPSHSGFGSAESNNLNTQGLNDPFSSRAVRRRQTTFAKHRRMSLFASAVNPAGTFSKQRKSLFVSQSSRFSDSKKNIFRESAPEFFLQHNSPMLQDSICDRSSFSETSPLDDIEILRIIFDFLEEEELLFAVGVVSRKWSDAATHSHANLMLSSVAECEIEKGYDESALKSRRSWEYLTSNFPWACFLSEGAFKRVYKVFNNKCQEEEAISVMDVNQIHSTGNTNVVGAELAVSVLLSSLVRRGICPNFVATRGMFSCRYEPPDNYWGTASNKKPKGAFYSPRKVKRRPREPKQSGYFQYIRMELCGEGDAEEFMKRQPNESLLPSKARNLLFQISFALYAAAEKFSLKHYDVKLLNVFLQRMPKKDGGEVILRYGLGEHTFALMSSREDAIIAKLADYGTANVDCVTNGQNVTIAQFTTLENTPPDFLILGDQALQGHGHDCFGLGLCMLHLFTGHAPYEEILDEVTCPCNLKKELRRIWENEEETQYSVVRSIILADVYKNEHGQIVEGEADETLYDTLYKYLVLFGIPDESSSFLTSKVMAAVKTTLLCELRQKKGRCRIKKGIYDAKKFISDRNKFSLSHGNNRFISRARKSLSSMDGGIDLLLSLVRFEPQHRASALDVLNSNFMSPLREMPNDSQCYSSQAEVLSFTAFSTQS
mmetsp:Transcript_3999/g.10462  ORF Transcript_3999/g.10462 Transcript_3999/m.10462 type:complete len:1482 (-) Transcript_3999:1127-5572(-)|eukprot:CAMPEP_0197186770 /NCGR_PEP_ID=MMETSP1423-20130617/14566_1 /TAXON_ID=476441 /ORGANISM="Pseudo-nitzschia heimii, Strain UNC1101" /LENGTH=1481 /DNA_ID=CAMNT_0042638171 /DNA_START=110 /DNA_END=4558 /DNA_ORIENTATION=-